MISCVYLGNYGRHGNQMFQYATLLSKAKSGGINFAIPELAFENGKFVKSEQNKLVTFPMNLKHRTVPHTDNNYERIVININYIKDFLNNL